MTNKRRYSPNISDYLAQCELNYALTQRLLRIFDANSDQSSQQDIRHSYQLDIVEQAKYTTTLVLTLVQAEHPLLTPLRFKLRLSHDAETAEVLEHNRNHSPPAQHNYPAQVEHYPDDKFQRNSLLQQSLIYCLEHPVRMVDHDTERGQ